MRTLILGVIINFVYLAPIAESAPKIIKAGADSSGGGKSVVCRAGDGAIHSIEMLDLYEARAMYGLEPLEMGATYEEALETVKSRLLYAASYGMSIGFGIDRLKQRLRILPPGSRLEPVDDASPIALPQGCKLEQAAVWVDANLVVADHELWQAMDIRNRAALVAHEVIYDLTRREQEKNSRRARKIVGHAFSRFDLGKVGDGLPQKYRYCHTQTNKTSMSSGFWAFPDENGMLVLQFQSLRGNAVVGRNRAVFERIRFDITGEQSIAEAQEIESTFETTRAFMMISDPSQDKEHRLKVLEWDELGNRVPLDLFCFDPFGPIDPRD